MANLKQLRKRRHIELPLQGSRARGRILGLDVSSICVGWALFEDGKLVSYGKFHPTGRDHYHGSRLVKFQAWLVAMLQELNPDQLLVEAPYRGRNGRTYGILSMYLGVVLAAYYGHSGEEFQKEWAVQPKQIKNALQLPVRRQYEDRKRQAVEWANRVYQLHLRYKASDHGAKINDADTADAIALVTAWVLLGGVGAAE